MLPPGRVGTRDWRSRLLKSSQYSTPSWQISRLVPGASAANHASAELWKCRSCGKRGKPKTGFLPFANNRSGYKLLCCNAFITVVESAELWNGNDLSVAQ